jgi:SAM-dependent methyltransferase
MTMPRMKPRAAGPSNQPASFAALHFGDGRHYDRHMEDYTADTKFYARYAKRGRTVLELGSGTGRVSLPLAKRGCVVTGVDFLPHMVRLARAKARRAKLRVRWIEGDVLTAPIPGRFELVLAPFNFLAQFPRRALPRVLARVRRLMAPGGLFICDVFNPGRMRRRKRVPYEMEYTNLSGQGKVKLKISSRLEGGVCRITHDYLMPDGTTRRDHLRLLAIEPEELDALLARSGFRVAAKYGGFDRRLFGKEDLHQIVEAR